MRICTKPKVYLVARMELASGMDEFLKDQGLEWPTSRAYVKQPETLTELAGRCCYMSFGQKAGSKTNQAYLDNLLGRNADGTFCEGPAHGSVLEHATFSFLVVGAGRGFSHEQVRHRAGWAYSQLSTRYCDFEREEAVDGTWDPGFTIPPLAQLSESTTAIVRQAHEDALERYKLVLQHIEADLQRDPQFKESLSALPPKEQSRALRKAARGAARDVLPNGTEAIMVMTANARAIWNTVYLRGSIHAEAEIRDVYVQISQIMEKEMPALWRGVTYEQVWDGSTAVVLSRDKL